MAFRRLGRLADALAAATTAVQEAPEQSAARYNLALVLADMGNRDEALKAITEVLARNPQHAAAQALRGELLGGARPEGYDRALELAGAGDMAGALHALDSALDRNVGVLPRIIGTEPDNQQYDDGGGDCRHTRSAPVHDCLPGHDYWCAWCNGDVACQLRSAHDRPPPSRCAPGFSRSASRRNAVARMGSSGGRRRSTSS